MIVKEIIYSSRIWFYRLKVYGIFSLEVYRVIVIKFAYIKKILLKLFKIKVKVDN
jgi:hypothetical protein